MKATTAFYKTPALRTLSVCVLSALPFGAPSSVSAQDTAPPPPPANAQMQAILDAHAALKPEPIETLTPKEARKQPPISAAVMTLMRKEDKKPQPVADIDEKQIKGEDGSFEANIYTPKGEGPFPIILYFHGGGWVIASPKVYEATPRAFVNSVNAVVVAPAYRKGPEHKFPAAHEDAAAAYEWVVKNAKKINGDASRIALMGESAGGNLAVNTAIAAREKGWPAPVHQVIVYPVAQIGMKTPSYTENAAAKPLNVPMLEWFGKHYLNSPDEGADPRMTILKADLKGLPSATVITAQIDPLASEGKMLAEKLEAAGVRVTHKHYEGVTHEFFGMAAVLDEAKDAQSVAAANLKAAFAVKKEE